MALGTQTAAQQPGSSMKAEIAALLLLLLLWLPLFPSAAAVDADVALAHSLLPCRRRCFCCGSLFHASAAAAIRLFSAAAEKPAPAPQPVKCMIQAAAQVSSTEVPAHYRAEIMLAGDDKAERDMSCAAEGA